MGRKTWEAIGSPLKNRVNIILSQSLAQKEAGNDFSVFSSINDAIKFCESGNNEKCFIIGGAQVYASALEFADKMIISEMKFEVDGDAYFPEYEKADWTELSVEDFAEFTIHTYIRKEKIERVLIVSKN
ncbi:MAG: dihydrofolate reductase [Stygiobacter sp.]|nr:MAG: dihydrofolate reductase [Stygiobacter sp.]KAF0215652.1 MAG: dihydrofolate [Ignavibacteria bacterium]